MTALQLNISKIARAGLPWVALAILLTGSAQAATVLKVDIDEATQLSRWVVRAEVVAMTPVDLRAQGDAIYTDVTLAVSEIYRGDDVPERVVMRLMGGIGDNGLALTVPGMPRLSIGEEAVLFLEETGAGLVPCGLEQGVWRITPGPFGVPTVHRNLAGLAMIKRGDNGALVPVEEAGPRPTKLLSQLVREIRAVPQPR